MSSYREFRFFSLALDAEAARLSLTDARGREYWTVVAVEDGRAWRERRNAALDELDAAIGRGDPPGELRPGG